MSKAPATGLYISSHSDPIRIVPLRDPNKLHAPTAEAGPATRTHLRCPSLKALCGCQSNIGNSVFHAPMSDSGCPGCLGGMSALDALTGMIWHEHCEAIPDAIPGTGWYGDHNGEIGDICACTFKKLGPWNVQSEWSNSAERCV